MKKNSIEIERIRIVKKLLEKYSGKKVILRETDGDEFISSEDTNDMDKEKLKPYQLYYIEPGGERTKVGSKEWLGGFDDINHLKRYAKRSYINVEKEKARQEGRNMKREIPLTDQGLPLGYVIKEGGIGTTTISEAKKK